MKARSRVLLLAAVFSTSLGVGLIFGFESPLIAVVLSRAGHSNFVVGAVNAVSLVAVIVIGPAYPSVIARLGLTRSIIAGVCGGTVLLAFMPWWPTVPMWVVLRILTGMALGLTWIASEVWMNRVAGDASRGAVMGVYGTVFSIGTVAGPLLLEVTGTRGWQPFLIGAACLLATLLPLLLLHRSLGAGLVAAQGVSTAAAPDAGAVVQDPGVAARARPVPAFLLPGFFLRAPVILLAALVAGLVESADLSLLPLYGLNAALSERAAVWLIAAFLAGNVVLQLPVGLLADRFGRRRLLGLCALTSGVGPLLLPASLATPALLWPLLFVWGGTLYAFYSQGIALLGEEFAAADLAAANTLFVMVYCCGGVLGPSLGGLVMDLWPRHGLPALLSAAALSLVAGLLIARGPGPGRSTRRAPHGVG
jgi:MFS family permease